jgi:hypothetical protein
MKSWQVFVIVGVSDHILNLEKDLKIPSGRRRGGDVKLLATGYHGSGKSHDTALGSNDPK